MKFGIQLMKSTDHPQRRLVSFLPHHVDESPGSVGSAFLLADRLHLSVVEDLLTEQLVQQTLDRGLWNSLDEVEARRAQHLFFLSGRLHGGVGLTGAGVWGINDVINIL